MDNPEVRSVQFKSLWKASHEGNEVGFVLCFAFSIHILFAFALWKRVQELESYRASSLGNSTLIWLIATTSLALFGFVQIRFLKRFAFIAVGAIWVLSLSILIAATMFLNSIESKYKAGRENWEVVAGEGLLPENLLFCFMGKRTCPIDYDQEFAKALFRFRTSIQRDIEVDSFNGAFKAGIEESQKGSQFKLPEWPKIDPIPADEFLNSLDSILEYLNSHPSDHALLNGRIRFKEDRLRAEFQNKVDSSLKCYWKLQAARSVTSRQGNSRQSLPFLLGQSVFPKSLPLPTWFFEK